LLRTKEDGHAEHRPAADHPGNLERYAVRSPGRWTLNAALAKGFAVTERLRLQLRAELFNALNHTNLGGLQAHISQATFGRLTSASARSAQIGARLDF